MTHEIAGRSKNKDRVEFEYVSSIWSSKKHSKRNILCPMFPDICKIIISFWREKDNSVEPKMSKKLFRHKLCHELLKFHWLNPCLHNADLGLLIYFQYDCNHVILYFDLSFLVYLAYNTESYRLTTKYKSMVVFIIFSISTDILFKIK